MVKTILRALHIIVRVLAFVATISGTLFGYVQYRSERDEPIAGILRRLPEYIPLSAKYWVALGICGAVTLLFLFRRSMMKKWAKKPPNVPDDQEMRRQLRWRLRVAMFAMYRHEFVPLYFCTQQNPQCACIHGAALGLMSVRNPFVLLRIIIWLQHKLDSDPSESSYPLYLLQMLAEGLQRQSHRMGLLWPLEFRKAFREHTMDLYTCVISHLVWTLQRSCFLRWQHEYPHRFPKTIAQRFPLEQPTLDKCLEELKNRERQFIDQSWDVFDFVVGQIEGWLNSTNTPTEVEEIALTRVIPTLLALPLNTSLPHDQISIIAPRFQQFSRRIASTIVRTRISCQLESWLQRLRLIMTTDTLVCLFGWLSIQESQVLIRGTFQEFVHLFDEDCESYIPQEQKSQILAEFDKQIERILDSSAQVETDWAQCMVNDVQNLSGHVKKLETALPIVTICDNLIRRFENTQERV